MIRPEGEPGAESPEAAGFVLAGGQSSRMGADKALVRLGGRGLAEQALDTLRAAGLEACFAGGRTAEAIEELKAFGPVIEENEPGRGPLGGICAALELTQARWAVFLPVDLPLLPAALLRYLLHHARVADRMVTLASVNGFAQSLPAVVDRATLPVLKKELAEGRGGCYQGFQTACRELGQPLTVLPVEMLVQSGQVRHPRSLPAARWFLNVNRPQDLQQAKAHLRAIIG